MFEPVESGQQAKCACLRLKGGSDAQLWGVWGGLRGYLGKIRSDLGRKQPKTCVWGFGCRGKGFFAKVSGSVKSSAEQNGTDVSAESGKNGIATVLRLTVISVALFGASNAYAATAGRGLIAVDGNTTLAISGATATGTDTIAIGSGANATTSGAIAIGRDTIVNSQNKSRSSNNITIGHTARAGDDSMEKVSQSIAIGSGVKPNVNGRPEGAWARGDQSIAIGGNVVAYGNSSVAIGGDDLDLVGGTRYSGNATDKFIKYNEKGVTIAAPTESNPNNQVKLSPVGLSNGGQRITNVAPGKDGTDAANVNQLIGLGNELQNNINQVGKKAYAGVAGAIVQGSIPQVTRPGATGIGVGSGYYGGQSAMAIGVSAMSDGGNWIVKGNFSANTDGHVGVGAGALYQW